MLPGGTLARQQLTKLKMYKGDKHPHESQNVKVINFRKINSKNIVKNIWAFQILKVLKNKKLN